MIDLVKIITIAWGTAWLIAAIKQLSQGTKSTVWFIMIIWYTFFIVPLILDLSLGSPHYGGYKGLRIAANDPNANLIYCLYMCVVPLVFYLFGRAKKVHIEQSSTKPHKLLIAVLQILMISPVVVACFSPHPELYLKYGSIIAEMENFPEAEQFNKIVSLCTLVSVAAVGILLMLRPRLTVFSFVPYLPWLFLAVWLNGKRAVFIMALVLIVYAYYQKGKIKGLKLLGALILSVSLMAGFSNFYQNELRYEQMGITDSDDIYKNVRVDFGRDDRTKMTIYAELHPQTMKILDYRGQSLLFDLTFFVPRSMWPDKPWPYAVYFTSAMFMMPPDYLGFGMTTSWLEEAIANFGWFGMLIGPLFIALLCRIGDSLQSRLLKSLSLLVAGLFLVVHLAAFMPLFLIWFASVFTSAFIRLRARRRVSTVKAQPVDRYITV
ncbi:hypothetical protein ACWGPW_13685 [Paenibacillus chitinolyticus]